MSKYKSGDIVEVLKPDEILMTLDERGTLDNLPFMTEMIQYCGKKYKVSMRVEKTCVSCLDSEGFSTDTRKSFVLNDVLFLENLRCSGDFHDYCKRECMIFWKESWLKNANNILTDFDSNQKDSDKLKKKLNIRNGNKYFCQSTELDQSTVNINMIVRLYQLIKEIMRNEISIIEAFRSIQYPIFRKLFYERFLKGILKGTPSESLNLKPGEYVEIKSFDEIKKTLDKEGKNKGLQFYHDMKKYCGKTVRVRRRLDKMINEATGEMIEIKDTVILENLVCSYENGFMGCPRARFQFWREIWLKRLNT